MLHGVITTDSSKCRQCYSCVRNCPVKAVKIKDGKAQIIQSRCIQCGNCVKHCARGAKLIKDGLMYTQELLETKQKVIALLAPSYIVSFYPQTASDVLRQLQSLGLSEVWETAIGAEYIMDYIPKYLKEHTEMPILSSACPAFVNLIERHYPSLITHLLPICSPMIATGRIIRKQYEDEDVAIIFIGPCVAKKDEIEEDQFQGCIDAVLTFEELKQLFKDDCNKNEYLNNSIPYYIASEKGRSIPLSAGINSNINEEFNRNLLVNCDGTQNCMELIEYIENHSNSFFDFRFGDTLMCRGCIDGAFIGNELSIFDRKRILMDFIENMETVIYTEHHFSNSEIDISRQFSNKKIIIPEPNEENIREILASIHKSDPDDELNCGACGYSSCREKAVAVYQGIAEVEMCIPYLLTRKNELYNELNGIFEASYDGLIVCDQNGNIIKTNAAWKEMLDITDKALPAHISELEQMGIIVPSVTLLVIKEKRRLTLLQESKKGHIFIATGNPIIDEQGNFEGVVTNIRDLEELNRLRHNVMNQGNKSRNYKTSGIIANSIEFGEVIETASQAAPYKSTVLLLGETGVGKDVVARFIHGLSAVQEGPFIKVNCGAIPENLLESELFGYESGAFTGAKKGGKRGLFELAHHGTIFLDEIGDLPLSMQVKLLQVIQEKKVNRIGATKSESIDVRIIAATNKNLQQMVKEGAFRSDLYYRLNVVPIFIPPLRERKDDILPLTFHLLGLINNQYGCKKELSPDVYSVLQVYHWPGNVRELQNIVERAVVTSKQEVITCEDLPIYISEKGRCGTGQIIVNDILPLKDAIDEVEKQIITQAYETFGNTYKIAEILGINQSTVVRKLKKFL